jgi:DNA recombination protein RmuC
VWETLIHVKQEIEKFGDILLKAQKKLRDADRDIDHLLTTRTNQLTRRLADVDTYALGKKTL